MQMMHAPPMWRFGFIPHRPVRLSNASCYGFWTPPPDPVELFVPFLVICNCSHCSSYAYNLLLTRVLSNRNFRGEPSETCLMSAMLSGIPATRHNWRLRLGLGGFRRLASLMMTGPQMFSLAQHGPCPIWFQTSLRTVAPAHSLFYLRLRLSDQVKSRSYPREN